MELNSVPYEDDIKKAMELMRAYLLTVGSYSSNLAWTHSDCTSFENIFVL